jgi:hypothetical protein
VVAVSIVTTSDDESPESIPAYDLDGDRQTVPINVVTPEGQGRAKPDSGRFPRLSAWAATSSGAIGGCDDDIDSPLQLFQESCGSTGYSLRCETRSIEEISPGIGRCYIEITTIDPPRCDASRGWADPKDAHGVRRPRTNAKGEHVCEVLLVALEVMDACVHDPSCADCGSGWCLSEVRPWARFCPATPPKVLRFVGGALPEPGSIHVTCLEPR